MNTFTADDWKAKGKWEEYKLMIETMHHVGSQMKDKKVKQITDVRDGEKGAEW